MRRSALSLVAFLVMVFAGILSALMPANLAAQTAPPPCDGRMAIVRVSDIKPEAGMDKFLAAVAAQKAWYASHARPDDLIFVSRVVPRGASAYSDTQVITYHYYPAGPGAEPKHDAAWDAFVKLFADSSTIKDTYFTCIPAVGVPAGK